MLAAIEEQRITDTVLVPTMLQALLDDPRQRKMLAEIGFKPE